MTSQLMLPPGSRDEPEPAFGVRELLHAIWTGRGWVIGVTGLALAAAMAVTAWMRPVYQSEALLEFDSPESSGNILGELSPLAQLGLGGMGSDNLDTKLGVLDSRRIAAQVADSLHLHVQLREPRAARDSVLRILDAPQQQHGARFRLTRAGAGTYSVRVEESARPVEASRVASVGVPARLGEISVALLPFDGPEPREIVIEVLPFADVVEELREAVEINRAGGGSRLVELSYRSTDRLLAAEVPNALTAIFTDYQYRTDTGDTRRQVQVLRDQVETYALQLRASEERLRGYREEAQVIEPESQVSEQVRRLSTVLARRDAHQIERSSLARLLREVETGADSPAEGSPYRRIASFPAFVSNAAVQNILESVVELENERAKLSVLRRPESRDVRAIDERIQQLEAQLYKFGTDYLAALDEQIESANLFLGGFESELAAVPAREVEYLRLRRETELLNQIYTYLQTRLKEAEIKEATALDLVRVIDTAPLPRHPTSPQPMVNLVLAGFLGLMLGSSIAIGRRLTDSRVHHRGDAEAAAGVPVLEVIPVPAAVRGNGAAAHPRWRSLGPGRRALEPPAVPVGRLAAPLEVPAEAYDSLWYSLFGSGRDRFPAVLLISSTSGNDGKSLTTVNLAATLARRNVRTVLVDVDMREGVLHRLLGAAAGPGLPEVLRGEVAAEAALQAVDVPGVPAGSLHFLSRGDTVPTNPADLIGSPEMRALLARLRGQFDAVILDCAPINDARDGLILRAEADAMLLVAQTGATEKQALQDASRRLRQVEGSVQGIILTAPVSEASMLSSIRIPRMFN